MPPAPTSCARDRARRRRARRRADRARAGGRREGGGRCLSGCQLASPRGATPSGSPRPLRAAVAVSRSRRGPTSRSSAAGSPASRARSRSPGGEARAPARGARDRLRRQRPQRWVCPPRRGDGIRQCARVARRRRGCGLLAPDRGVRRPDGRARRRRVPPDGQPPARRRGRAGRAAGGVRGAARGRLRGRVARRAAGAARRPFPGALFHPDDGVLQPARLVRRLALAAAEAGVEIREQHRSSTWTSSRRRRSSSRPTAIRAACSASSRG